VITFMPDKYHVDRNATFRQSTCEVHHHTLGTAAFKVLHKNGDFPAHRDSPEKGAGIVDDGIPLEVPAIS
jgi:hypothetical protein